MENPNLNYGMQNPYEGNNLQPAKQTESNVSPMTTSQMAFPEVFYKIQPYIMMVCDQLDAFGSAMPRKKCWTI